MSVALFMCAFLFFKCIYACRVALGSLLVCIRSGSIYHVALQSSSADQHKEKNARNSAESCDCCRINSVMTGGEKTAVDKMIWLSIDAPCY